MIFFFSRVPRVAHIAGLPSESFRTFFERGFFSSIFFLKFFLTSTSSRLTVTGRYNGAEPAVFAGVQDRCRLAAERDTVFTSRRRRTTTGLIRSRRIQFTEPRLRSGFKTICLYSCIILKYCVRIYTQIYTSTYGRRYAAVCARHPTELKITRRVNTPVGSARPIPTAYDYKSRLCAEIPEIYY